MEETPENKAPEHLRNYQAELFEIVKNKNSILFLPTGSGKTCIAIWLIKHYAADLKKPFSEGGKRTIFIVNTKELAYQQASYVRDAGNFKVRVACADEGVDHWTREQWEDLEEFEVIVLTAQTYLNALTHRYMRLEYANLLIFDECHHATKAHPMREIMKKFDTLPYGKPCPRVLGLSATILNCNKKSEPVPNQLAGLELTFRSCIITSNFTQDIKKYATKPEEVVKDFEKLKLPDELKKFIENEKEVSKNLAKCYKLKDDEIVEYLMAHKQESDDSLINVPGVNRMKLLTSAIQDIEVHCLEFGIFIGFVCCQLYVLQMYRFMFELERNQYVDLVLYFINVAQVIRKTLYDEIMKKHGTFSVKAMMESSTAKVKYLFDVLRTLKPTDKCIIFVERKMTAKALCFIVKMFARSEKVSSIKIDFITGSDCNPLRNNRELLHENKMKEKVLKNFRGNHLNVLIATNIVEEGIDVPNCGLVIMFDEVKTYRSYVQSKGRARLSTSKYIILNDVPRAQFLTRLADFRQIEESLNRFVRLKDVTDWNEDESPGQSESGEFYTTPKGASIKKENCISLIYRYCSTLPSDLFTSLVPHWWKAEAGENKICKLQLPINSPIRGMLLGPPCSNLKTSKQTVAFEAVKLLHKLGDLDDHLLPISGSANLEDIKEWVPNWEEETTLDITPSVGQDLFTSKLRLSAFLLDSRPVANEESFIHFINIKPKYDVPDVARKKFCHNLLELNYNFGIMTRKALPNLCKFPVYSDLGRCEISIQTNCEVVTLDEKQMSYVARFHKFLFLNVIRNVKKFLLFDTQSTSGYFIVPLTKREHNVDIAWKVVRQKIETTIRRPSELERETEIFSEENYLGKVVAPWYKEVENPTFYIVTNYLTGLHLHSELDNKNITYREHFENTYKISPLQPGQPLMEVRTVTKNFDSIKPRAISSSTKQKKKSNVDRQTFLPPEFVIKQTLHSVYWYKSNLLPSILHRFQQLLLAEDLRQTLVEQTGVGRLDVTIDEKEESEYFVRTVQAPLPVQHDPKIRKVGAKERRSITEKENMPDVVQDIYHCEDLSKLTVGDIKKFVDYVDQPLYNSSRARIANLDSEGSSEGYTKENGEYVIHYSAAPPLTTLKDDANSQGPNQYEILQALTLRGANDTIDLERFETLGDSLLKYLVSFAIFIREVKMNEGLLSSLKARIIGNKYLFDCAKKHGIPDYIQAATFTVERTWIPPSFCVPPYLEDNIPKLGKFSSLLKVTIPYHEQFSGKLSDESVDVIRDELKEFFKTVEDIDKSEEALCLFFLGQRKLSHKSIADVVEALIGVYLQTSGIRGAFNVMKHFGILQKEDYTALMSHKIPSAVPDEYRHKIFKTIPDYEKLERLLDYEFKDKALLLQALTHPSCLDNQLTDCYQKLEFIGDAVLDFLITSYIYEYCGKLSPGQITDLRSALVNNNTFGALTVRLSLHKFMLDHNKTLEDAIRSFVSYQKSKNFEIHGNDMMVLLNDDDTTIAEEVDVPKALGDIFESLAGAIFVDSQFDLSVVWRIYFNIMAEEIAKFCSKVPINPIRALYEMNVKVKFDNNQNKNKENEKKGDKLLVRLCVPTKNESLYFVGRGSNTASAKRAAAKLALKRLGYSEFVI